MKHREPDTICFFIFFTELPKKIFCSYIKTVDNLFDNSCFVFIAVYTVKWFCHFDKADL